MKRTLAAALAILAPAVARADAPADATALFAQGVKDMKAGNFEAACKELAGSLARYEDSGTKGALATCYTRQNKLTSAWALWTNLADTEPDASLRADAAAQAQALEPRLPRFVLKVTAPVAAGLAVTVNGAAADPSLAVPLPVDPGPVTATARAPGHQDWSEEYTAVEGNTLAIEVPALRELPPAITAPPPPTPGTAPVGSVSRAPEADARHHRHVYGVTIGAAGLVVLGVGAIFGAQASSKWSDAKTACGGGSVGDCPSAGLPAATKDVSDARSAATLSTVGFTVGGAAVVTGAILYLTAPSLWESHPSARLAPAVGPSGYGLVLTGGW